MKSRFLPSRARFAVLALLPFLCLPGKVSAANDLPGYEIIPLGQGHNNRLCLAATIAGKKGLMMLDTGANSTLLNEATYQTLLQGSGQKLPAGIPKTARMNGVECPVAIAPNFQVGKANLGSLPVCLASRRYLYDSALARTGGDRLYDGLLGENILRRYNAIVDCGRFMLYLNTDPAQKHSFASAFVGAGWTRVAMSDIRNDFTVPCTLNGHRFRMIVDTGAPFTTVNKELLSAAHLEARDVPGLRGGLVGTRAEETGLVSLPVLEIGGYPARDVHMISTPQSFTAFGGPHDSSQEGAIVGLLGGDVLAANDAVVDVGNKSLFLKRATSH